MNNKIFEKFTKLFVIKQFGYFLKFVFYFLLAKKLSPHDVGIFFTNFTYLVFLGSISKLGIDMVSVKKISTYLDSNKLKELSEHIETSVGFILTFSILISLFFYLTSNFFIVIPNLRFDFLFLIPFFSLLSYFIVIFKAFNRQYTSILIELVFFYLPITAVLFCLNDIALENLFLFFAITIFILLLISYILLPLNVLRISNFYKFHNLKEGKDGFIFMIISFLAIGPGILDTIMLNQLSVPIEVAVYSVTLKIALLISFGSSILNSILLPLLPPLLVKKKFNQLRKEERKLSRIFFFLSIPIFIVIILFAKDILLLFGNEYSKGDYALIFLSFFQIINVLTAGITTVMVLSRKKLTLLYITLFSFILNLILNFYFIPIYGATGCAFATAFSSIFLSFLAYITYKYYLKNNYL